ncbi:hypothetical protein T440DRAFT_555830 [Plenodomus tracheiphilus IPT5]|uniref:Rhodopsin domain-containing protein n=1 Tax=Plenodomus tracheiphilus IPT5 TaxID=1408161 RepID=A0A6A7B2M6_9PLEO|nr:hypothetical protein T440DRAFT_555830 [Plenodomus tracheiphilus IPT5]
MPDPNGLPTKNREVIAVAIFMLFLSTFFTCWRVFVRFRVSSWMGPSDWLMVVGAAVSNAGMIVTIVCGFNGAGRLLEDPFWQPNAVDKMIYQNHLTFASQLLNVYGMWVVKLSICVYLLALNFSRGYRRGTVVFVTVFNFILPVIQHFGLCRPLASRWDTRIIDKQCWPQTVRISIAYTQAISNIITDLVYATAPIAYLRTVQLNRRTQWSVRTVFLMSLLCTTISALKLWDFERIQGVTEPYYESVTLFIWSMTEVAIGIVVANLPPLRKSFDGLFRHVSSTVTNKISRTKNSGMNGFDLNLSNYNSHSHRQNTMEDITGSASRLRSTADDQSDKAILSGLEEGDRKDSEGILRTTHIDVDRCSDKFMRGES